MLPRRLRQLELNLKSGTTEERLADIDELGKSRQAYALDLLFATANGDNQTLAHAAEKSFLEFATANPKTALRHASMLIRHESAFVLGENKVVGAIDELARIVRNDAEEVLRLVCVQALGRIGVVQCVPGLRLALHDAVLKVRQDAFEALRAIGGIAVQDAVADLLEDYNWELRRRAFELLQSTGWFPITRPQKAAFGIAEGRFDAVVTQGSEAVESLLTATLRVNDPEVRRWSAVALARIGSQDVRRKLRGALAHPSADVRAAAAEALKAFGESSQAWLKRTTSVDDKKPDRRAESVGCAFQAATWFLGLLGHP